jgi:hypothetical protein
MVVPSLLSPIRMQCKDLGLGTNEESFRYRRVPAGLFQIPEPKL